MSLPAGQVTALVGPNGAGKTTLLLILAGLLAPDGGRVLVGGADPVARPFEVRGLVGWMPDTFGVYDGLTAREYLELFGAAYHLSPADRAARAGELLATVKLERFSQAQVHVLSRGQKQKLAFARAIVHRPSVLLLDEPASGLDPRARVELRALVRAERDRGASVVVSSHILSELEEMADLVVFVDAGRSRGTRSLPELAGGEGGHWRLRALDPDRLRAALERAGKSPVGASGEAVTVAVSGEGEAATLVATLVREGIRLVEAAPEARDLEGAYLALEGERAS